MKRSTDTDLQACAICESVLREEIEKHDAVWKETETVKWAKGKGLNFSKFALAKHRANHLKPITADDNGNNGNGDNREPILIEINTDASISAAAEIPNGNNGKKPIKKRLKVEKAIEEIQPVENNADNISSAKAPLTVLPEITDQLLLDTVRDRVYQKLLNGEIELDLADGFKAIEIKYKIADQSQNEKLLLEILNEIRAEELGKR